MIAVTIAVTLIPCSLHLGCGKQLPEPLIETNRFPPSGKILILLMLLPCCRVSISICVSVTMLLLLLLSLVWAPVHLCKVRSIFRFE